MSEILVERYENSRRNDWNEFNKNSKNGLFFFHRDFLEYHADRFTDHSLLIYKKNKIIAIFPASVDEDVITSHGGLTFGSLVISLQTKSVEVLEILKEIKSYYKNKNLQKIIYKTIPYIFSTYPAQEDLYALYREDAFLIRREISSVIDIQDAIRFSETKRQLVKKCATLELVVEEQTNYDEYWKLLCTVLLKFDSNPTHSLSEIKYLQNKFPENLKLFTAKVSGKLLGGILIFNFGNVIHTQYMATSDEGRKIGALDYINSVLIDKYKDRKYYSFGISTENQGRYLNEGLIQQKENMGGRGITLDTYEIIL